MNVRTSLLGLFLLALVLVVACGPVTPGREKAMSDGQPLSDQAAAGAVAGEDDSDSSMEEESGAARESGESDTMVEVDFEGAMEVEDADRMVQKGSEAAMEEDGSDSMMEEGLQDTAKTDDADSVTADEPEAAKEQEDAKDALKGEADEDLVDLPAWFEVELTDVTSGEVLAVADLRGKVILVETMAIWCSNCLRQQKEVKTLHEALGTRDDLVILVLDVDPNEDADNLKTYADKYGFSWTYGVAPREVAREIGQLYGDQFLNPPSTPMFIIDQHGEVHLLPFGHKTVQDLRKVLEPFLAAGI